MLGFLTGAIAGGFAVWYWGDRVRQATQDKMDQARDTVARGLEKVQSGVEGALDTVKPQIRTGVEATQDDVRADDRKTTPPAHR